MTRTILQIAQEVCDRVTINPPASLFDARYQNDRTARILRVAAKDTLRDMIRDGMKNGMQGFNAQWVFATRPGVYAYRMPPDFYKMIAGTEQRQRWPYGILGPVSPQTWSGWLYGIQYTAVPMGWRIKNNLIWMEPPPQKAEIIVIEYVSFYPVTRAATDEDLEPVNGYLQPKAPLIPRDGYLSPDAYPVAEDNGSKWGEAIWGEAIWGSVEMPFETLRRIPVSSDPETFPEYQVRAPEFTGDGDTCALHDDHVLSLGMTWRLRAALAMPYAEARDEYEREKDVFLANDASRGRTIVFGGDCVHNEVIPIGSGQWIAS